MKLKQQPKSEMAGAMERWRRWSHKFRNEIIDLTINSIYRDPSWTRTNRGERAMEVNRWTEARLRKAVREFKY
jgi:hypothetical protein